jgi:hypothetical protein
MRNQHLVCEIAPVLAVSKLEILITYSSHFLHHMRNPRNCDLLLVSELTKETHFRKTSKHHQPVANAQTSSIKATSNSNGNNQNKKKPTQNYDIPSQERLKSKERSTTSDRGEVLLLTTNQNLNSRSLQLSRRRRHCTSRP